MQSQPPKCHISSDHFQSSQSRWLALTHRTSSSHSQFFYGVKTTKIYCRPTCSARLARRTNVVFYDTEDQARRDGFRPCKRCKPDDTTFVGEGDEVVTRLLALLRRNTDESRMKVGLKELAKEVGVTPSYLCRVFKRTMGITVGTYMKEFERNASEGETHSPVRFSSRAGTTIGHPKSGLSTPSMTATSPSVYAGSGTEGLEENCIAQIEDIDLDLDLDDWLHTEYLWNNTAI